MNEIDHLDIDGRLLLIFLAVVRTGAATAAAAELGLTQSAVSHALKRLAGIVGEPLFVKRGRGIVATQRALALEPRARTLVEQMRSFAAQPRFEPSSARITLKVAANDLQRDLVLPEFWRLVSAEVERFTLRVVPSEVPHVDMLRSDACDLLLTPYPPSGSRELLQRLVFKDRFVCFTDADVRQPPRTRREYAEAEHVTVVHPSGVMLQFDKALAAAGVERRIAVIAPTFAGVSAFLKGTPLVATLPSLLDVHLMRGFRSGPLPLPIGGAGRHAVLAMYMVWHARTQTDPMHQWLRQKLVAAAGVAMKARGDLR
ncbi:MAG TPA: LysR family transcriptional regulator [Hyphomicrobiaceae bacterium]|nr:LysR family transcriptional regulator [Hyphomicrobiaceae bacterium]